MSKKSKKQDNKSGGINLEKASSEKEKLVTDESADGASEAGQPDVKEKAENAISAENSDSTENTSSSDSDSLSEKSENNELSENTENTKKTINLDKNKGSDNKEAAENKESAEKTESAKINLSKAVASEESNADSEAKDLKKAEEVVADNSKVNSATSQINLSKEKVTEESNTDSETTDNNSVAAVESINDGSEAAENKPEEATVESSDDTAGAYEIKQQEEFVSVNSKDASETDKTEQADEAVHYDPVALALEKDIVNTGFSDEHEMAYDELAVGTATPDNSAASGIIKPKIKSNINLNNKVNNYIESDDDDFSDLIADGLAKGTPDKDKEDDDLTAELIGTTDLLGSNTKMMLGLLTAMGVFAIIAVVLLNSDVFFGSKDTEQIIENTRSGVVTEKQDNSEESKPDEAPVTEVQTEAVVTSEKVIPEEVTETPDDTDADAEKVTIDEEAVLVIADGYDTEEVSETEPVTEEVTEAVTETPVTEAPEITEEPEVTEASKPVTPVKSEDHELIGTGYVHSILEFLNLRAEPDPSSTSLAKIPVKSSIQIYTCEKSGWYYAKYQSSEGYVNADYVAMNLKESSKDSIDEPFSAYTRLITSKITKMYAGPSEDDTDIVTIPAEIEVVVFGKSGDWYYGEFFNGKTIYRGYLKF